MGADEIRKEEVELASRRCEFVRDLIRLKECQQRHTEREKDEDVKDICEGVGDESDLAIAERFGRKVALHHHLVRSVVAQLDDEVRDDDRAERNIVARIGGIYGAKIRGKDQLGEIGENHLDPKRYQQCIEHWRADNEIQQSALNRITHYEHDHSVERQSYERINTSILI